MSQPEPLPGLSEADLPPAPLGEHPRPIGPELSPGARLTAKRRAELERGSHPVTHAALIQVAHPEDTRTCGTCAHLWRKEAGEGHWFKCELAMGSAGDGPDVTKRWPACILWDDPKAG